MLFILLFTIPWTVAVDNEEKNAPKPYVILPLPLDLPNRNDRAEQCWLRIEDIELTETLAVYCHIAEAFLHYFIHEYNTRKMIEDKVDVSLWNEKPRAIEDYPAIGADAEVRKDNENTLIDWKRTTIEDPTIHRRFYVTKKADCRLIMYSRDGMSNYQVECAKVLYFINVRMNSCTVYKGSVPLFILLFCILFIESHIFFI